MYVLGDEWLDGYLDEAVTAGHVRIRVTRWRTLAAVKGLYFVRRRDPKMVLNYVAEIGVRATVRKILSRSRESLRNHKFVSVGSGVVLEAGEGSKHAVGTAVVFLAPSHPRCMERIVLPDDLVASSSASIVANEGSLMHVEAEPPPQAQWVDVVAGWSEQSSNPLPVEAAREGLSFAAGDASTAGRRLQAASDVRERTTSRAANTGQPTAALVGLGNYAKTIVLPNIAGYVQLDAVHELDPTQMGRVEADAAVSYDSLPWLRPEEKYDAVFVAGYHHTHADVAIQALRQGSAVVVEKPLVTTRQQLTELLETLHTTRGRLFACFQRRYLEFNHWARKDLGISATDPISYHCIVYEVPLPPLHWYRWPASRSRLVSNGCHWIDHFLFLNDFASVVGRDVFRARDGTVNVSLELANGAFFTMTLTEHGADRTGVQDYVEIRAGDGTAYITNAARYRAERGSRVVRTFSGSRMAAYAEMYHTIAMAIAAKLPGDSIGSVRSTAETVLDLEGDEAENG